MPSTRGDENPLRIVADPTLRPEEKETSLCILGESPWVDIHTFHPTATRALLDLPGFEVEECFTRTIHGEDVVVGVRGRLPLGSLKIGVPRRDQRLSRVFPRRRRVASRQGCLVRPRATRRAAAVGRGGGSAAQGRATPAEAKDDA